MNLTEKKLGQSQIDNAAQTVLLTNPSDVRTIVKNIIITNTTAVDATISLWDIPGGDSADDVNCILSDLNIPANDFMQISTLIILDETGQKIEAKAGSATSITISLYGAEIS